MRMFYLASTLLDLTYLGLTLILSPFLLYHSLTRSRHTRGLLERFGLNLPAPVEGRCIWVHGVSVGEILAAGPVIEGLKERCPGYQIVLSTSTSTGQKVAKERYRGLGVFYFPLDFSWSVRWVLARIRPSLVVLMELELWPNFLWHAAAERIPVAVVNGRISERSARRYGYAPNFVKRMMFHGVWLYCVQNDEYASRLRGLGVLGERIQRTGNVKYDSKPPPETDDAGAIRGQLRIALDAPVLLGGSTHPSEEASLLECYQQLVREFPKIRLILVPRHSERGQEISRLVQAAGFEPQLFSKLQELGEADRRVSEVRSILVVDVMGELARLYAAADVCFVGGSLIRHGGQNMLEPASLGKAVIVGPHCFNFADSVAALIEARAIIQVETTGALLDRCRSLFLEPGIAQELGQRALETLARNRGATTRTVTALMSLLSQRPARSLGESKKAEA